MTICSHMTICRYQPEGRVERVPSCLDVLWVPPLEFYLHAAFGPFPALSGIDRCGFKMSVHLKKKGRNMRTLKRCLSLLAIIAVGTLAGCSTTSTKAADVSGGIRTSLDQAGLNTVTVSQDRDKSVVTLGGNVAADGDKAQAESIARSMAGVQVVSNQIGVIPPGVESDAKKVNADLDKGIENNLDAALIKSRLHENVKYAVKNHVVTLTGDVDSQTKRARAEEVALTVVNVQQVVNELQVRGRRPPHRIEHNLAACVRR